MAVKCRSKAVDEMPRRWRLPVIGHRRAEWYRHFGNGLTFKFHDIVAPAIGSGRSEAVTVLFVEPTHEADEGFLIIHRGSGRISVKPVTEILMQRLIIPTGAVGA